MADLITLIDGRQFPQYAGEALAWSLDLYMTLAEQAIGYPRARTVIAAMRVHRPEQLEHERYEMLRGTFDKVFGANARKALALLDEVPS